MYKSINLKKPEKNVGLEILRVLLCFWVVLFHCINHSDNIALNFILKKKFHVPCFFFISFYYIFPIIREKNSFKMKLRLERLFVPYIIWPSFIWSLNNLLYMVFNKNRFGRILSLNELKLQLITGRIFVIQLWYLFNLLFFTIFFFIFSFLGKYIFIIGIILIGIICYIIQYLDNDYKLFQVYKDSISHSVGHFIISFPIAVLAFITNKINTIHYLEILRYKSLIFIFIIILFIFFNGAPNTYNGIDKNFFSFLVFVFFHLISI